MLLQSILVIALSALVTVLIYLHMENCVRQNRVNTALGNAINDIIDKHNGLCDEVNKRFERMNDGGEDEAD